MIINADDVGVSTASSDAIAELAAKGALTGCSVVFNMEGARELAVALKGANADLDIGAHINITEGKPLSGASAARSLTDSNGLFPGLDKFLKRWLSGRARIGEIRREIECQIEAAFSSGVEIINVDSHHNIHLIPGIAAVAAEIAGSRGVKWMRPSAAEVINENRLHPKNMKYAMFNLFTVEARKEFGARGMKMPDRVVQIKRAPDRLDFSALVSDIKKAGGGVVELVCHPSVYDESLPLGARELKRRAAEIEMLSALDLDELRDRTGYVVSSRGKITL